MSPLLTVVSSTAVATQPYSRVHVDSGCTGDMSVYSCYCQNKFQQTKDDCKVKEPRGPYSCFSTSRGCLHTVTVTFCGEGTSSCLYLHNTLTLSCLDQRLLFRTVQILPAFTSSAPTAMTGISPKCNITSALKCKGKESLGWIGICGIQFRAVSHWGSRLFKYTYSSSLSYPSLEACSYLTTTFSYCRN
jgi:hypothetical protein